MEVGRDRDSRWMLYYYDVTLYSKFKLQGQHSELPVQKYGKEGETEKMSKRFMCCMVG